MTNDPNGNIGNIPSDMLEPRLTEMKYRYISKKRSIVFPSVFQDILKYVNLPFLKYVVTMTLLVAFSALLSKERFRYKQNKTDGKPIRVGINFQRMCCILSCIRKYKQGDTSTVVYCHDDDFESAMDIIDIYIVHSLVMIDMMPINPKKLRAEKASCPYRVMDIMNNLS